MPSVNSYDAMNSLSRCRETDYNCNRRFGENPNVEVQKGTDMCQYIWCDLVVTSSALLSTFHQKEVLRVIFEVAPVLRTLPRGPPFALSLGAPLLPQEALCRSPLAH